MMSKVARSSVGIAAVGLLLGIAITSAQQRGTSSIQLKSVTSLTCSFPTAAIADWENGEPQVHVRSAKDSLTLVISRIELNDESATIVGPGGRAIVTATLSGSNLYFLDLRPNGDAFLTTVFAEANGNRRLRATHAQTSPDIGEYYGECEVPR